jgi:general secretion pathway protein D
MFKVKYFNNLVFQLLIVLFLFFPLNSFSADSGKFSLNFKKTDIEAVINVISKYTKLNYLISPEVKGKVTFISYEPMNKNDLTTALSAILDVHGYKTVQDGKIIKIVPKVSECQKKLDEIKALINS